MISVSGILIVIAAMSCWAVAGIGFKFAMGSDGMEDRDPITSLVIRASIITLFLFVMTLLIGDIDVLFSMDPEIRMRYWIFATLAAICSTLGDICYFFALRFLDSSRVYPLINTQMLFTYPVIFVSNPDSKDRGMQNFNQQQKKKRYTKGIFLGMLTGFFWSMIYINMAVQNQIYHAPLESNFAHLIVYTIIIWIIVIIRPKHFPKFNLSSKNKEKMKAYLITGFFGIISAGIGDWIYQIGIIENGVAISITIASTTPLVNQILAIIILKEKFRKQLIIGVTLIVIANILIIF